MTLPPPLPREHGAWVMLTLPVVLGLAAGGVRSAAAWLVAPAVVLVFLAHSAIVPLLSRLRERKASPPGYALRRCVWGSAYLAAAGFLFGCAVLMAPPASRTSLLEIAACSAALAGIYALAAAFGSGRSIAAEVVGMAGMALTAAMMRAAAGEPIAAPLFGASTLALAYSLSSLSFVRAYERMAVERRPALAWCAGSHAGIALGVVAAISVGASPALGWVALVPVFGRTAWGLARRPASLRVLGRREIGVAVAFTLLAAASLF